METPGEDAAEQARAVSAEEGEADAEQDQLGSLPGSLSVPLEVDEADAAEQIRDVGYGDEDYR
jgi:hypothetical protein